MRKVFGFLCILSLASTAHAFSDDAVFSCRSSAFYALKDNVLRQLDNADAFTVKLDGGKAVFDNGDFFQKSEMDIIFNLNDGLETRTISSHFKLGEGEFWYALATYGYAIMGQGYCTEL